MPQFRVRMDRVKDDMVVGKDVFGKNGVVIVPQGVVIDAEVRDLLMRHRIEFVDVEYHIDESRQEPKAEETEKEHFERFERKFEIAKSDIGNHLDDLVFRDGKVDMNGLIDSMNSIVEEAKNSMELCDMLFSMKEASQGVYSHSIRVGLLNQLIAEWLNLDKEEKELLSLCGLFHDIGKLRLSQDILNKTTALTPSERVQIDKHPINGYNILKNKDVDFRIKQAVLTHHERLDGSGYPLKIYAEGINKFSRITAVADTFDTMTSKQPSREALSPFDVVYSFETSGFNKFDTSVMMVFLANILNNFIHYKVLLSDGAIGEVVFINKSNLSRPLIKTEHSFIDLTLRKDLKIVEITKGES